MNVLCLGSGGRRRRARGRPRPRLPRAHGSTAASVTSRGWRKSSEWKGAWPWLNRRLHELSARGSRSGSTRSRARWLQNGFLAKLMREDAVVGVTSNPTIFQKALAGGDWYDEQLKEVLADEDEPKEIFYRLAVEDIQEACDVLRPVWDGGGGKDGYVSMEVDPTLAYEREATIEEAMRLHEWIDRPNLFVKIPATEPGLGAIEECIARGRSINVTLIFGLDRYAAVAEAYIRGLERLVEDGGDPRRVASVASFFVSRVDTEADQAARRGRRAGAEGEARGRERQARLPARYKEIFAGPRWEALAAKGATPQRCLWASTSTKNPDYPDTLYVDELIGPETVNTMPVETIEAFQDHGTVADTLERGRRRGAGAARRARAGRRRLRRRHRHARARGRGEVLRLVRGAAGRDPGQAARARARVSRATPRSSSGSGRTTRPSGPTRARTAGSAGSTCTRACARTRTSCARSRRRRASSSTTSSCSAWAARPLAPEVLRRTFGVGVVPRPRHDAPGGDPPRSRTASTSSGRSSSSRPSRARRSRRARTSSTSGSGRAAAARSSPRSPIPARSSSSWRTSGASARPSPASRDRRPLLGALDVRDRAGRAARRRRRALPRRRGGDGEACRREEGNPGLELGLRLGEGWQEGRDKVCLDASADGLRALGRAAARGVDREAGQGLVPAPGEPADGPDRQRGEVQVDDPYELGAEFYRWEFATAVAGHVLGINPFDQPDVQAAKDKTNEVLAAGEPDVEPRGARSTSCSRRRARATTSASRRSSTRRARASSRRSQRARARRAASSRAGLGPRYLHSTGQLHKGGPEHRPLRPGGGRDRRGAADPRPRVRLRPADPLAGRRRPRRARGARPSRHPTRDWRTSRCNSGWSASAGWARG